MPLLKHPSPAKKIFIPDSEGFDLGVRCLVPRTAEHIQKGHAAVCEVNPKS